MKLRNWNYMDAEALAGAVLEDLVRAAAAGDEASWRQLWVAIEPRLHAIIARPRFLGRLGQREDDRRNIVVEVMGRLRADGFHRLGLYLEARRANPALTFMSWLRVVAKRVGIDYLRGHPDYIDRRREPGASAPGRWIEQETLPPASQMPGARVPVTTRGTAREMLRFASAEIPEAQRRALELWIQSHSDDAIAAELGLASATEAHRLVRAALERLRRQFRSRGEP